MLRGLSGQNTDKVRDRRVEIWQGGKCSNEYFYELRSKPST